MTKQLPAPTTMKAAIATGFGAIDDHIRVVDQWRTPTLENKNELLVRVLACALAPGDVRILSGQTDWIQLPKGGHPYVVGGDVSGIVVASNSPKYSTGDYVVSRFALPGPVGGLAEYTVVKASLTEHCPRSLDPVRACGLTASAMAAKKMVHQFAHKGDRALVIGGSGGVGSSVLQYLKRKGAAYIAAVSTQDALCLTLGADRVIDYNEENWWELKEYQAQPFDIVFDMVGGDNWEKGACSGIAVKCQGLYLALPPGVHSAIEIHGWFDMLSVSLQWIWRTVSTRLRRSVPRCIFPDGLDLQDGDLNDLLQDVLAGHLHPVLDPSSPWPFTHDGVRQAFCLQKSCHAHGKVVVTVTDV
jgi:NADPH:quinone reductase-like Zn-dependent oxidoreductase